MLYFIFSVMSTFLVK